MTLARCGRSLSWYEQCRMALLACWARMWASAGDGSAGPKQCECRRKTVTWAASTTERKTQLGAWVRSLERDSRSMARVMRAREVLKTLIVLTLKFDVRLIGGGGGGGGVEVIDGDGCCGGGAGELPRK